MDASVDGCGITQDVGEPRVWGWEQANPACSPGWRQRWPLQLSQFNPDVVVVLLGTDDAFDRRIDGQEIMFDSPEGDDLTRNELQEAVTVLSEAEPTSCCSRRRTTSSGGPVGCASTGRRTTGPGSIAGTTACAVATRNSASATIVDLNQFLDPDGKWSEPLQGVTVHTYDKMHLSPEGADLVANWLAPQVVHLARGPVPTGTRPLARRGGPRRLSAQSRFRRSPVADVLAPYAVVELSDQAVLLGSHVCVRDLAATEPLVHLHERGVELLRGPLQLLLRGQPPDGRRLLDAALRPGRSVVFLVDLPLRSGAAGNDLFCPHVLVGGLVHGHPCQFDPLDETLLALRRVQ